MKFKSIGGKFAVRPAVATLLNLKFLRSKAVDQIGPLFVRFLKIQKHDILIFK